MSDLDPEFQHLVNTADQIIELVGGYVRKLATGDADYTELRLAVCDRIVVWASHGEEDAEAVNKSMSERLRNARE